MQVAPEQTIELRQEAGRFSLALMSRGAREA